MEIFLPDTKTVSLFFNKLMETPIKRYRLEKTMSNVGVPTVNKTLQETTVCNYHSISIDKSQFRDKIGDKSVFLVCIPLETIVGSPNKFLFEIENKEYQLIGCRQATRKYEQVWEVVLYEWYKDTINVFL